ncbi:MAG TPA: beta-ketoacyl synthase N-terminal-like domain-containing protein, partial [Polyangiaceae bacterium]
MTSSLDNKFAVVGMGGIFPDADGIAAFWNNIVDKRVSIRRLASDSVERHVFYRPEVKDKTDKGDKSYTDLLAPIDALEFDPPKFRLPPAMAKHMDDNQKLSLLAASQAIAEGGLEGVDRGRVCVFMGATMVGSLYADFVKRFNVEEFQHALHKRMTKDGTTTSLDVELLQRAKSDVLGGTFSVSEDSAPGCLPNIIAARIASVFDLHGHAFVLDAACASGLAAIVCGIQQLQSGEADAVICGAADMPNRAEGRILFSGIGALSPDGSFPFDARANGFVIGQGGGVVIIKRLRDAIAADNRIYAVVTGYGQCSDGRGKAIAAPNERWQSEAIRRACVMAGYPVDTIELIEAHGTSTQVGDVSEVTALKRSFSALGATRQKYCGLTSVKSNIGHLKSAAGIAGFIKTALALSKGILPPTANFECENPQLGLGESPFYVLANARDWTKQAHPRRAGVNAFGFGGADYHIALEEYRAEDYSRQQSITTVDPRSDTAPVSVAFFSGDTYQSLLEQVENLLREARQSGAVLPTSLMRCNARAKPRAPQRLAMTLRTTDDLAANAQLLRNVQTDTSNASQLKLRGIHYSAAMPIEAHEVAV